MSTLAFIEGLGSPIHWLILLVFMLGGPAVVVYVILLALGKAPGQTDPRDDELDRRRRQLELEKLELENEERRRRLNEQQPPRT